jgi:hypothetical protein
LAPASNRLEVESLDLGADVRAVGLELIDPETREPVAATEGAQIWASIVLSLAGAEPWMLDFFAHLERVRDFCKNREIPFREPNPRAVIVGSVSAETLAALFERFAGETFGMRAGAAVATGDPDVESGLARHGVDAYHAAFPRYLFCAVCDFENGFLTVLSNHLWASEVIRKARAAFDSQHVEVDRPA